MDSLRLKRAQKNFLDLKYLCDQISLMSNKTSNQPLSKRLSMHSPIKNRAMASNYHKTALSTKYS